MTTRSLKVGIGRTEITPKMGVRLGGYGVKERPVENVIDPMHSTALYLEQDATRTLFINLDWICVEEEEVEAIRSGVAARVNVKKENITVGGTHSHSTPNTISAFGWGDKEREYIADAMPRVIESAVLAEQNAKEARVGVTTTLSETGVNRRSIARAHTTCMAGDPNGLYDPTMTVIHFKTASGPLGSIVHYGAHGTAMGITRDVSRDWIGVMKDRVESQTKAPVVFIDGAIGDVGPRTNQLIDGGFSAGGGDGRMSVLEVGLRAATDALRAWFSIKEWRDDFVLDTLTREIRLPYAPLPTLELAKAELAKATPNGDKWGSPMCEYRYWKSVVEELERGDIKTGRLFTQTITRLGPIAIAPFPGEMFSGISLRLRNYSPFAYTLCASVTNGSLGYLPTREARHRGGYETWVGRAYGPYLLADDIDDHLVSGNLALLRELAEKTK